MLVYSLITLAILPPAGRAALLDCAGAVRARGGLVAFDGNYRPRLWPDVASARAVRDAALAQCDIGLPTVEDEAMLGIADLAAIAHRWAAAGVREVIVKLGPAGCLTPSGSIVAPPALLSPIDTSGAGDAFDAGYLDARLRGRPCEDAAAAGHRLAGWVVMQAGAAPSQTDAFDYQPLRTIMT